MVLCMSCQKEAGAKNGPCEYICISKSINHSINQSINQIVLYCIFHCSRCNSYWRYCPQCGLQVVSMTTTQEDILIYFDSFFQIHIINIQIFNNVTSMHGMHLSNEYKSDVFSYQDHGRSLSTGITKSISYIMTKNIVRSWQTYSWKMKRLFHEV